MHYLRLRELKKLSPKKEGQLVDVIILSKNVYSLKKRKSKNFVWILEIDEII